MELLRTLHRCTLPGGRFETVSNPLTKHWLGVCAAVMLQVRAFAAQFEALWAKYK